MSICSVDGCDRTGVDAGMCKMHRTRVRRHGSPDVRLTQWHDVEARFWSYVEKTDACWLWTGSLTYDGYAIFRVNGARSGAHRFAYESTVGPIPPGLQIDHLCRVRKCVRPDHLEPVTPAENRRRAAAALGDSCYRGHHASVRLPSGARYCPTCRHEKHLRQKESA